MLSIFLVASFVLPSVLGHCCFPDKSSAVVYDAGNPFPVLVMTDFTLNKYSLTPSTGDVEVILNDMNTGKKYTKYRDGSCRMEMNPQQIKKCIPDSFKDLGENVLGKSLGVMSFGMKVGDYTSVMTVTDDCLPVILVQTVGGVTNTQIYANVTTSISDSTILNQDVSDCEMED